MRVIGYTRVSTEKQAEGLSLEAQQETIERWCVAMDWTLMHVYADRGASGKSADQAHRPELHLALEALAEADALIITKLDRLTRSVRDLVQLVDTHFKKKRLVSVSENIDTVSPAGRLVVNVLGSFAQYERERIAERVKTGMAAAQRRGQYIGGVPPYGWRRTGEVLEVDPAEQQVLAEASALRGKGYSWDSVAALLSDAGRRNRAGNPLQGEELRRAALRLQQRRSALPR